MAYDIGPRIGVDGEKEFKSAMSGIETQIKALKSELKLAATEMDNMSTKEDGAAHKADALTKAIDATKEKVELIQGQYDKTKEKLAQLGEELDRATTDFGENSEEALKARDAYDKTQQEAYKLETKLNNAKSEVNKMTNELDNMAKEADDAGDETKDLGDNADKAGGQVDGLVKQLRNFVVGGAIALGVKALAEGMRDVASAAADAVKNSAAYADDVLTQSTVTGMSTDAIQEARYMEGLLDVSSETLAGSQKKLVSAMYSAQQGGKASATVFDELGISVTDANGELRDSNVVFGEAIDALAGMENETQRDAYAMKIFGKSAQDLNPMIEAGSDRIAELREEAHRMGYVLDEEALASLGRVQDAFDRWDDATTALRNNLSVAFAPVIEKVATALLQIVEKIDWDKVAEVIGPIIEQLADAFIRWAESVDWEGLFTHIANVFDYLIEHHDAVKTALLAVAVGLGAIAATSSPIALVALSLIAIVTEIAKVKKALDEMTGVDVPAWAAAFFSSIATGPIAILDKLNGVFGDNKKTAEDWKDGTTTSLEGVAIASATASQGLVQNGLDIQAAFKAMGDKLRDVVDDMKTKFVELKNHVATVKDSIITGLTEAFNWISELPGKVLKIGGQIVEGLWRGISDKVTWLIERIKGFCQQALDAIKNFFGIHSPSRVMRDQIGAMMMAGWAKGITANSGTVKNALNGAAAGLMNPLPSVSASDVERVGAGVVNGMAAASGGMGGLTITVPLYLDGREIARAQLQPLMDVARQEGVSFA